MSADDNGALIPAKEGTLMDAAPAGAVEVHGHIFAPIVLSRGQKKSVIGHLSQRELKFTHKLLSTGNLSYAAQEIGITEAQAKRFVQRPTIRVFIEEKLQEIALARGTTVDNNLAWLRQVRDGETHASKEQLDAAKVIARVLRPASAPGVAVQVNNYGAGAGAVPNPYSSMSMDQLLSDTEERVSAFKGRGTGQA